MSERYARVPVCRTHGVLFLGLRIIRRDVSVRVYLDVSALAWGLARAVLVLCMVDLAARAF